MSEDCLAPERLDARPAAGAGARHGVAARRRLHGRIARCAAVRRRQSRAAHDVVVVSITHRLNVLRIHPPDGARRRTLRRRAATLGHKDIVAGLDMGSRQHRPVRRRSEERHDLRSVGRRRQSEHAARHAGRAGPVSPRRSRKAGRPSTSMPRGRGDAERRSARCRASVSRVSQIDELQRLPVEQVLAAMQPPGGSRGGFATSPVVDGDVAASRCRSDPGGDAVRRRVPLLIGSTETEVTWSVNTDYTPPADAAALRRSHPARALRVDAAHARTLVDDLSRHGRPRRQPARSRASSWRPMRLSSATGVDLQAERKSACGAGAGLRVSLPVVFAGQRRPPARDALHGHPVRVRQRGQQSADCRQRRGPPGAGGPHEPRMGGVPRAEAIRTMPALPLGAVHGGGALQP